MTVSAQEHSVGVGGDAYGDIFNVHIERVLESAPQPPPQVSYLHRLIEREDEKRALLDLYQQVKRTGRGGTVFLMGQQGSGRRALTGWMQKQAREQGDAVAAARFWDPDLLPEGRTEQIYWDGPAMDAYGQALAEKFQATSRDIAGAPWVNLVAQLAQQARMLPDPPNWPDDPRLLNRFVRDAARRKPLLLTLEHLEWADLWIDLLRYLIDEVVQDLPVLLLITLTSPAPLGWLSDDQHTEPTRLVETLVRENLAQDFYLEPIATEQIVESLGPVESEVSRRLRYLAADEPLVAEMIWEEWLAVEAVVRDADGTWRVNPEEGGEWWVYGEVRDHAHALLERCLEPRGSAPPFDLDDVQDILSCAAVEGSTFTAPAVARVMGVDPDTLIDFFDDCLTTGRRMGNRERESGLLIDLGFADVTHRPPCLYAFARPYLHHVWGKYISEVRRKRWSRQLAEELEKVYYPETAQVAPKLIELFEAGEAPQRAQVYRQRRRKRSSLATLRWHVQFLTETVPDDDRFGTYRLFDRGFALSGRLVTKRPDLWEEGVWLAQELARRAKRWGDKGFQAEAYRYMSWHYHNAGRLQEALPWAQRAVDLYRERYGSESIEMARGLSTLGLVQQDLGDLEGARASLERALALWREALGEEHPHVATALSGLGLVQQAQGDLAGARASYERALAIRETVYGRQHPETATTLWWLGVVAREEGNIDQARDYLEETLAIYKKFLPLEHPRIQKVRGHLESLR